ncbi:MAG TPA: pirin family protein [Oligoflexus sp.]|uniref:pirin family protein n=1 Tax=Oligoflexus sp. TaxID=1971216 RepID=UPI002D810228|nr:pirin family protein [Oligoflexus sp.]HET9239348.1 pirin family protein [Oligoflexus sp.]
MVKKARPPAYFTRLLPPSEQATGSFDQGAITEQKMIGFAGEGSAIHRIGPLYYWAWAQAARPSSVAEHPHRGFEIMSYILEGTIEHRDSLGHASRMESGDLQLMQTGSGLDHEEHFVETPAEILQIWFDPHFRQETMVPPRYAVYPRNRFLQRDHATILLGEGSPISLVTPDVSMHDLKLSPGDKADGSIAAGMGWAALVLHGAGTLQCGSETYSVRSRDFIVHQAETETTWKLLPSETLRLIWIRVPLELPYPLFPKPR